MSFNFFSGAPKTPDVRPLFNVGMLLDIPTGEYIIGANGEAILNGGVSHTYSVTGPGNMFKTDLLLTPFMIIVDRYASARMGVYDTENSLSYMRLNRIAAAMRHNLYGLDIEAMQYDEDPRVVLTQRADIEGDEMFEVVKAAGAEKRKNMKQLLRTTPFVDMRGDIIRILPPTLWPVDSFSAFGVSAVQEKIVDKNAIGESGGNTVFMKDGAAKTQMIIQIPNLTVQSGIYIGMTAHIGNTIQMDPYAPKPISLTFSRNGTKQKGVPEKFQFINNHLLEVYNATPLYNSSIDKSPKYPKVEADKELGNDLFLVTAVSSRNKYGPSGVTYPFVVSQSEGMQVSLTEFNYIKNTGENYGISGNDRNYNLDLYPDVKLSRTTVREKLDNDYLLQRACTITSELLQMKNLWRGERLELHCTPKELYDDLAAKGYDWNQLLDTRGYWVFEEDKAAEPDLKPFLSTMDLLRMRAGLYHPYWMEPLKKAA